MLLVIRLSEPLAKCLEICQTLPHFRCRGKPHPLCRRQVELERQEPDGWKFHTLINWTWRSPRKTCINHVLMVWVCVGCMSCFAKLDQIKGTFRTLAKWYLGRLFGKSFLVDALVLCRMLWCHTLVEPCMSNSCNQKSSWTAAVALALGSLQGPRQAQPHPQSKNTSLSQTDSQTS